MGSSLCSSSKSQVSDILKTPKPTKDRLTSQISHLQTRALHPDKKRKKLTVGKSLSFQKISLAKLLQGHEIHNKHLLQSVSRMKKSLISSEVSPVPPKELLENLSLFYPNIEKITIIKNEGNNILVQYEEKSGKLWLIKRKTFEKIEDFSSYLIHIQNISKFNIPGIEKYKEIRLHKLFETQYIADIFKEKKGENLLTFLEKNPNSSKNYLQILEIIKKVSIILHQLHRRNLAFKTLKYTSILVENPDDFIVNLAIGGGHTSVLENLFVDFYVKNQEDYQSYDIISLGFVFLTLFSPKILIEDLYKTRNNKDIEQIFEEKGQEIPKIIVDFMRKMLDLERKNHYSHAIQMISELESLILKGIQNDLKQDFLSEVFLDKISKKNNEEFLYFHKKNKIFVYNEAKKITVILKVFLGKRKWNIRSPFLGYSSALQGFITLASPFTAKIAIIPFKEEIFETNTQKIVEIKRNIEFLYEIKDNTIKSPEIIVQKENFYVISSKIYQISVIKTENSSEKPFKFEEKCIENSLNFPADSYHYSFFDTKLENLFILFETPNFFKNGITIFHKNMRNSTNFSKIQLKFHLNNAEMLKSFYSLNISLKFVYFCIEISENIFLINVSKILLILDLSSQNFNFYSFSSLYQLQNYEYSKKFHPMSFFHTFETRNLPFQLDFSCGKLSFEAGILKFFCKKDSEILLCKFILIPNQSCISLINCIDLSTNANFMIFSPKEIKLEWGLIVKQEGISEESIKKIGDYEILEVISEENNSIDYKARKNSEIFCLKSIEIAGLEEFELLMKNLGFFLENSYLIETKELFLHQENGKLFAILVREYFESTLLQEFLQRKTKNRFYSSKNLAFLLKCVFKGLIFLLENSIIHGNLELNNVVFTDKGYVKIKGWYLEKKPNFSSFINDAGLLLLDLAKLEFCYEFNENIVENSKEFLDINYPGLSRFLMFLVKNEMKNVDFLKLLQKEMEKAYFKLQYKDLDFSRYQTEKQKVFWINYGDNSLMWADISSQKHHPVKVIDSQQQPYVFSTFNTFTFDLNENLYITGQQK